jgi:hypothetical protein
MNLKDRVPDNLYKEALEKITRLSSSNKLDVINVKRLTKSGKIIDISIMASPLYSESGLLYGVTTTEREIKEAIA